MTTLTGGRRSVTSDTRGVPMVDLIDETFVVAAPADVAAALHDPQLWRRLWPGLDLVVFQDRGVQGLRFTVTGELVGTSELWVEAYGDGAIVHYYCRCDVTRRGSDTEPITGTPRRLARTALEQTRRHAIATKAGINALKDRLEAGRAPGTGLPQPPPPAPGPARAASRTAEITPDG